MNLKTNFKNDKFSGLRKYKMTTDTSTGLTTLEDKTEYQEIGDIFSADDINETNKAVLQNNSEIQDIKGIKKLWFLRQIGAHLSPIHRQLVSRELKRTLGLLLVVHI